MTTNQYAATLEQSARADFERMSPCQRAALMRAIRENPDNRGRGREITMPPMRGSRKHPW